MNDIRDILGQFPVKTIYAKVELGALKIGTMHRVTFDPNNTNEVISL